jgi:release factor glutamine methyltransferase
MGTADPQLLVASRPTVGAALEIAAAVLCEAGIEAGRSDAEWLLAETLGIARGRLSLQARRALQPGDAERYVRALRRRMAREPLQRIVGSQAFRDVVVKVNGDVLVPRPETELLAGWALELLPRPPRAPSVIDVGTGSGCIACALASERNDLRVIALDVSPAAVAVARDNVAALGLGSRVSVHVSDLFAGIAAERADVIVSNPPYLPTAVIPSLAPEVRCHDPRLALDGGPEGLDVVRRLVAAAPRWLAPAGRLVLETAGGSQARAVMALMRAHGFVDVVSSEDLAGIERFVAGGAPPCRPGALIEGA